MAVDITMVRKGMDVLAFDGGAVGKVAAVYPEKGLGAGGLEARRPAAYVKVRRLGAGYLYVPLDGISEVRDDSLVLTVPLGEIDNTSWVFRPDAVPSGDES